jgi:hypothetical protein
MKPELSRQKQALAILTLSRSLKAPLNNASTGTAVRADVLATIPRYLSMQAGVGVSRIGVSHAAPR